MTNLRAARRYADKGWHIFPLWSRDRRPIYPGGIEVATADVDTVARWWDEAPESNIALAPGRSGLIAIGMEPEGSASAAWLGLLSVPTLRIESNCGVQLLFRRPPFEVESRSGLAPGISICCDSGFILLPPSILPGGERFRWGKSRHLAELPPVVVELLRTRHSRRASAISVRGAA